MRTYFSFDKYGSGVYCYAQELIIWQLLVKRLSVVSLVKDARERGLMDRSSLTIAVCYVARSPSSLPVVTAANALVCILL